MKIRNGFVSNSSSSSFALFYKNENLLTQSWQLEDWLNKNKFEDHELWTLMEGGCDGDVVRCEVNKSILDVLMKHKNNWHDHTKPNYRGLIVLVDPIWKDEEDYDYGFCIASNGYREDYDKYTGEGYLWEELNVDYHGPKTAKDWKYEFGDISHEEYWNKKK